MPTGKPSLIVKLKKKKLRIAWNDYYDMKMFVHFMEWKLLNFSSSTIQVTVGLKEIFFSLVSFSLPNWVIKHRLI